MTSARYNRPKLCRTISAALLALALPAAFVANSYGRAAAEGAARHARAGATLSAPLSVEWKFTGEYFGSNPASPVVSADAAYIVCGNAVYCVSTDTGGLKWRYPSEAGTFLPKLVEFSPTLANGKLYVPAPDGLYAFNAADGKLAWRYIPSGRSQVISTPIALGDNVYFIAQNGRIYGVNGETGNPVGGAYSLLNRPLGVDLGGDLANEPSVADGQMYFVTANQDIKSFNVATGVQKWSEHITADVTTAKPVIYGDGFYLAAGNTLSFYRSSNGQMRWTIQLPTDAAVPPSVDSNGNAFVILMDRTTYAINPRGKGIWRKAATLANRALTQPVVSGGLVIVPEALGSIEALDCATGDLKWNYTLQAASINASYVPTDTAVAARPVVAGDTLYTLSDDGSLTAFSNNAVDDEPPSIDKLEPENGAYINGRPPLRISAHIWDCGSGLDLSTLTFKLDNQPLPRRPADVLSTSSADNGFQYKPDTSTVEYTTIETESGISATLPDGHHTVTVSVKDWKGNELKKTWTFVTDDSIKRVIKSNTNTPNGPGQPGGGRFGPSSSGGSSSPGGR